MSRNALEFGEQAALFVSIGAMDVILQLLGDLCQFVLDHPEVFFPIATGGLGFLGWLMPKAWRSLCRSPEKPLLTDNFPFECIPPGSDDVVQQVLDSAQDKADPLADFNIPYQSRQTDQDVQRFLEQKLARKRWLLILGHKGLGKTREMAELARIYSQEGWFVLRLKNQESGLLTEPARFPGEQIGMSQPKLLFVLDNLNQAMFLGKRRSIPSDTASEQDGQRLAQALDRPFHDRLLKTLQFYENTCGNDRIRVIATARNEPSELEKLELDQHPDFWDRFEQYELLPPSDQAIVNLLSDRTTEAKIATNPAEFASFARSNDGTFRNIVENLIKVKNRGLSLTAQTFEHSLEGTWEERYHNAIETYPIADSIYDAVDLLRQMGIALHDFTVLPTAQLLITGNYWQRFKRKRKLKQALDYLSKNERILQPRDGQIEAKGNQVEADPYIPVLLNLLLNWVDRHPQALQDSLLNFGAESARREQHQEALMCFDQLLKLTPDSSAPWYWRGYSLHHLERYEAAIVNYDKSLEFKADDYQIWYGRAITLSELKRNEEAVASCDEAIAIKPDYDYAWNFRGIVLGGLKRYEEAIDSYNKALEFNQNLDYVWSNQGLALGRLERYEEAIHSYNQALKINIDNRNAWIGKAQALSQLEHFEEAVSSYDKALELQPDNYNLWNNRGIALKSLGCFKEAIESYKRSLKLKPTDNFADPNKISALNALTRQGSHLFNLGLFEEAIDSYAKAIELKPDFRNAWYNKACCYTLLNDVEKSIEHLQRAIELDSKYRESAKTDADFDGIRSDDRFQSLINNREEEVK